MLWKLKRLQLETEERGNRLTYENIHERTGIAISTLSRVAQGEAQRIDTNTVEALLSLFSEELGRKLEIGDLIEWVPDK